MLALTALPLASEELRVEPAQPTTADEIRLVGRVICPVGEDLEAFAAGRHLWHAMLQPRLSDPLPCGVPAPVITVPLGRLERGFHTAVLMREDPTGLAPLELSTLTFEVRQADLPDLSLGAERFRVSASWSLLAGSAGEARAVPLSSDSGAFWFFRPDNLELLVKVLDGCAVNGHFWVLAAGLTDVGVELEVVDTATGARWIHQSPAGTSFGPVQDTGALACGSAHPARGGR